MSWLLLCADMLHGDAVERDERERVVDVPARAHDPVPSRARIGAFAPLDGPKRSHYRDLSSAKALRASGETSDVYVVLGG